MTSTEHERHQRFSRGFRRALVIAWVALSALWTAPSASAHSTLSSSDPAADTVLTAPPSTITLTFSQHVLPDNDEIAVTVGTADPVVVTPKVNGPTVVADLGLAKLPTYDPHGGAVVWKVGFRVVSADGHPVSGLYTFTVGSGAAAGAAVAASGGSWIWPVVGGVLALLAVVAVVVLLRMRRNAGNGRVEPVPRASGA